MQSIKYGQVDIFCLLLIKQSFLRLVNENESITNISTDQEMMTIYKIIMNATMQMQNYKIILCNVKRDYLILQPFNRVVY